MPSRALCGDALPRTWGLRRRDARFKRSQDLPLAFLQDVVKYFRSVRTKSDLSFGGVVLPSIGPGGEEQRPNYFLLRL